jgi:hypothetical protein
MLLGLFSSACAARITAWDTAPPKVTTGQTQFADPFAYCAAVGTADAPDERYFGPPVPETIVQDLRQRAEIADVAPADWIAAGTVWRCMDGEVWACFVGANLPCSEKAATSTTPHPEMEPFCNENPNADAIPEAITGRATIYEWRCLDGTPHVVGQQFTVDSRGSLLDIWYELARQ